MRLDAGTDSDRLRSGCVRLNRDPAPMGRNNYPLSRTVLAPAAVQPNPEVMTDWTPYGTRYPVPYQGEGWDALHGRVMDVSQADLYDSSPNPFPANPVWDVPNAWHAAIELMRLRPSTSAHPGLTLPSEPGPTMVFRAPPSFGVQTQPIIAVGV